MSILKFLALMLQPLRSAPGLDSWRQILTWFLGLVGFSTLGALVGGWQFEEGVVGFLLALFIGAFVLAFIAGCKLQIQSETEPMLELGPPVAIPREVLHFPSLGSGPGGLAEVEIWRIPIINRGGPADHVTVTVERVIPALPTSPGLTPTLKLHRPTRLHEDNFPLAKSETEYVDILAVSSSYAGGAQWLANTSANDGYVYFEDDMPDTLNLSDWREFTVAARAANSRDARRTYSLWSQRGFALFVSNDEREAQEREFEERVRDGRLTPEERMAIGLDSPIVPNAIVS